MKKCSSVFVMTKFEYRFKLVSYLTEKRWRKLSDLEIGWTWSFTISDSAFSSWIIVRYCPLEKLHKSFLTRHVQ